MRNKNSLAKKIISISEFLPYFTINNLSIINVPSYHLNIALSRLQKRGKIIRLKKGYYTSIKFIEKSKIQGLYDTFAEFISTKIYAPSYLSLDYVLYENNILTEMPVAYTLVTKNKTYAFSNKLGRFIYHKIKDELFNGYKIIKKGCFVYYKADKAKALFDFLYLRKNLILNKEMTEELRLNLDNFTKSEIKKLKQFIEKENSKKMKEIFNFLFKYYND